MKIHKLAFAIMMVLASCKSHEAGRTAASGAIHFLQFPATGKTKTQRMHCKLGALGVAVFTIELSELESGDWKISMAQVELPNSKTVVLSDRFIQKMWSPGPEIDSPTATEKEGSVIVTISTGDGGESTTSALEISKELTVAELL